mgnify:CR=1 FL=1|jgi:hypothetical protein|tara:strand:- start:1506 stop:1928 length:423 start_codon:yes stop_codon:yes gene_type:complete
MEKVLLKFSPQFQRKWADLELAAENQVKLRHKLSCDEKILSENLTTQLNNFVAALVSFESAALKNPTLPVFKPSADPQAGDLVVVSENDDRWTESKGLLPDNLQQYRSNKAPVNTPRFFCRLTLTPESKELAASREKVYF